MSIRVDPESGPMDFEQSLKPIVSWLCLLGINLKASGSPGWLWLKRTYFLINVSVFAFYLVFLFRLQEAGQAWVNERKNTVTFSNVFIIDTVNVTIHAIVSQFLLSFCIARKWQRLQRSLENMQHPIRSHFYVKLRRNSVIGVVCILVAVKYIDY